MSMNPYAPPTNDKPQRDPRSAVEAASQGVCPQCGSTDVHQPGFTWWGGALGPKLFNHTVCRPCGFGYNAKTGESNRNKIITYLVVVNAIVLVLLFVIYMR